MSYKILEYQRDQFLEDGNYVCVIKKEEILGGTILGGSHGKTLKEARNKAIIKAGITRDDFEVVEDHYFDSPFNRYSDETNDD